MARLVAVGRRNTATLSRSTARVPDRDGHFAGFAFPPEVARQAVRFRAGLYELEMALRRPSTTRLADGGLLRQEYGSVGVLVDVAVKAVREVYRPGRRSAA